MLAARKGGDQPPAVFTYGVNQQVRTMAIGSQPWFVAKDVCGVLGLENASRATALLDDDEVLDLPLVSPVTGQRRKTLLVNESGLYNLIFRSRKPGAKAFRRWVTGEVLPSIRRTGGYRPSATRPGQSLSATTDRWDLRHLPYDRAAFLDAEVRTIVTAGRAWYSLTDVQRAMGTRTSANATARRLPEAHRHMAWLFGATQCTWLVDDTGLRMLVVASGRRIGQLKLDLNIA